MSLVSRKFIEQNSKYRVIEIRYNQELTILKNDLITIIFGLLYYRGVCG